jgi:hypothetical protein
VGLEDQRLQASHVHGHRHQLGAGCRAWVRYPQGSPRHFDRWFKGAMIQVRMPNGDEGLMRIPQDIEQQSHYNHYDSADSSWGLVSGVVGGNLNKDKGWMGDNETLVSPEAGAVYMYGHHAEKGERIVDKDLQPEIDKLVNQVSEYRDY